MKSLFSSKTIWFGVGQMVFGIVGLSTGWLDNAASMSLIMTGVATFGLRLKTSQPVSL